MEYAAHHQAALLRYQHGESSVTANKLILFYVPAVFFFMMFFSPLVLLKNVQYIFVMHLAFVFLAQSYRDMSKKFVVSSYIIVSAYVIYVGASNQAFWKTLTGQWMFIAFFVMTLLLLHSYFKKLSLEQIQSFLKFVAVLFNILALYCLAEYYMKFNPLFSSFFAQAYTSFYSAEHIDLTTYRVSGSMQHPIVMGNFLAVGAIFNYALFNLFKKKVYLIFTIISGGALFFTFSRSSYFAVIGGLLAYALFEMVHKRGERKPKQKKITKARMAFISLFVPLALIMFLTVHIGEQTFLQVIIERFSFDSAGEESSILQRTGGIKYVIDQMIASPPLQLLIGHGFGSVGYDMRAENTTIYLSNFYIIDNQYFTFFYEIGLVGMLALICTIGYVLSKFLRTRFATTEAQTMGKFAFAGFVVILINIFFYEGFYWSNTNFLLAFVLAIGSFAISMNSKKGPAH